MTGTDVLFRFGADISAIREANVKIADSVAEAARNSKKSWLEFYATLTMVGHGVRRLAQMFSSAWSQAARFEDAATRHTNTRTLFMHYKGVNQPREEAARFFALRPRAGAQAALTKNG